MITSGSASSAQRADWQPLANRKCLLWPDNDEIGEKYMQEVAEKLILLNCQLEWVNVDALRLSISDDGVNWLRANPTTTVQDLLGLPRKNEANAIIKSPSPETATLLRLAALSQVEYDRIRITEAQLLGIRTTTLDNEVKQLRTATQHKTDLPFTEVTPWPEPIMLANVLADIVNLIQRFIVCPLETAHAATLWIAMTWFIDTIQIAPLAIITAPEKRCGKSQLLSLMSRLVKRPLSASNITPAALFRAIDAWQPTLLIDETDAFMRENEELRGLLNCGHTRESAYCLRVVGDNHELKRFSVWSAKALAGIGQLADTLISSSR